VTPETLTLAEASRIVREATKDKSYRAFPLGQEAARFLRSNRGRWSPETYRTYETCLDKLARHFADLELADFEPPVGTERLEEFIDTLWGDAAPRTRAKNLSMVKEFFKWAVLAERLYGDPARPLRPPRKVGVYRSTFSPDQERAIFAENAERRDRLALHLLLKEGLRKGALARVQFKHFDHARRRLTIFTKGGKVQTVPIPDPVFWNELEHNILEAEAAPDHYLLPARRVQVPGGRKGQPAVITQLPDRPMSKQSIHRWWYRCLERAGIVARGVESGEKMHKARHTAGQRLLDHTRGNIKAVQKLLGHSSLTTTGDIYVDWDIDQLEEVRREQLAESEMESSHPAVEESQ
jgi:site-specific recombinase XerD